MSYGSFMSAHLTPDTCVNHHACTHTQANAVGYTKSYLKDPKEYDTASERVLRTAGGKRPIEAQPYASIEEGVTVAPSAIAGLGLFTTRKFTAGDRVAVYSGEMVKCVKGNISNYLIEAQYYNKDTKVHDKWYLNSAHLDNASGRTVNDACSTWGDGGYTKEHLAKIPERYRTNYRNNVGYKSTIKPDPHEVIGQYCLDIVALYDIEEYEELFGNYGHKYWERPQFYSKFVSPDILTGEASAKAIGESIRRDV